MGNAPLEVVWEMDAHTQGKHALLKEYLIPWLRIIDRAGLRATYIDGFAGPGRYLGGEVGSPLLVLDLARGGQGFTNPIEFVFIENRQDRYDHLKSELAQVQVPQNFQVSPENRDCVPALRERVARWRASPRGQQASFSFIDPFGFNVPFDVVESLLRARSSEVLVTLMSDYVKRFASSPDHMPHIDGLLGEPGASVAIAALPPHLRTAEVRRRYRAKLEGPARFVCEFSVHRGTGQPVYDLFFATNSAKGHYVFKEAMWRVDETGDFRFDPSVDPTQGLLFKGGHREALAEQLQAEFRGKPVITEEILSFVRDKTIYLDKHCRAALELLETQGGCEGQIHVESKKVDGSPRRGRSFPPGVQVRFPGAPAVVMEGGNRARR